MNAPELTETEARWLDSIRDGHGPTGTVDPHTIRVLVQTAQRMKVVTQEEMDRRDAEHDAYIVRALDKVAHYYRTPRHRRTTEHGKDAAASVSALVREFINGWKL